jgi:hypothetical protein
LNQAPAQLEKPYFFSAASRFVSSIAAARAGRADPADDARRIAHGQRVIGQVFGDDAAGPDHRPATDRDARDHHCIRPQGGAAFDENFTHRPVVRALERAVGVDGAGHLVVREDDVRPDEHSVFQLEPVVERRVVLNLDVVADDDAVFDVRALADDALLTDTCLLTDLDVAPDHRAVANLRFGRDFSLGMDPDHEGLRAGYKNP